MKNPERIGLLFLPIILGFFCAGAFPENTPVVKDAVKEALEEQAPVAREQIMPARRKIDLPVSYIETVFSGKDKVLRQFGYPFFTEASSLFSPVLDIPVGPDYTLGPGDEVVIEVWGMIEGKYRLTVDTTGGIYLAKIGRLQLWGLTFTQAEKAVRQQFAKYYKEFELSVSLGRLRTIKIFVLGDVNQPGGYDLPSLATAFTALYAAGGPSKTGTLRNIRVLRDNQVVQVMDLYRFLLNGDKSQDIKLQSGDTVFIPPLGDVVAISGDTVKRPGIYEIKEAVTPGELLALAGGLLPVGYQGQAEIENLRVASAVEKIALADLCRSDRRLKGGELVRVYSDILPKREGPIFMELRGEVNLPGVYSIQRGERLSGILAKAGGYTKEAFIKGAVFTRPSVRKAQQENMEVFIKGQEEKILRSISSVQTAADEKDNGKAELLRQQRELIALIASRVPLGRVSIRLEAPDQLVGSPNDVVLEDGDALYIPKPPMFVQILGAVKNPGAILYTGGKSVDYYLAGCGGVTKDADKKNIFIIRADGSALSAPFKRPETDEAPQSMFDYGKMYAGKPFSRTYLLEQGDVVIVPEELRVSKWEITKDIFTMFYQLGLPAAAVLRK